LLGRRVLECLELEEKKASISAWGFLPDGRAALRKEQKGRRVSQWPLTESAS